MNQLKKEYDLLVNKQYQSSYTIENQKKRIEDIGKTLKNYEKENKAMRELLRLWV
jgi:division protein CdvB (Snf7/Vps24/ESCRT-III family)